MEEGREARGTAPVRLVHADAHFRIGSAHEAAGQPCQDYALAESGAALPFAVVSDGCSQSGRTDVGARLLALSARRLLGGAEPIDLDGFREALLPAALSAAGDLGLGDGDLDATLGIVQALPGGGVRGLLFGDGYLVARAAAGIAVTAVDWAGNMPGYPCYAASPARRRLFLAQSTAAAAQEERAPCRVRHWLIQPGAVTETGLSELSAEDGLMGLCVDWPAGVDVAAAMTDGVAQVSGTGWAAVVAELTAITSARQGAFATRRLTRALARLARGGCRPVDDLAVGALAAPG